MSNSIESKIEKNKILAPLTTYKIGGPAEYFINIKTKEELMAAVNLAHNKNMQLTILSGGSNVLISDDGISGLVVKINNCSSALRGDRLEVGAGVELMSISRLANSHAYSGIEWAVGVPGSVGGAIRGNAGAYGKYIADVVETVECYDTVKQEFKIFSQNDCDFFYKESHFKRNSNLIIWEVILRLEKSDIAKVRSRVDRYIKKREESQPRLASAGCTFKNLLLSDIELASPKLAAYIQANNPHNSGKIGAGWLIDLIGLKGKAMGGVKVSLEHANFIVNTGKGKASDVKQLISYIKKRVYNQFGIKLEEEIQYLGK